MFPDPKKTDVKKSNQIMSGAGIALGVGVGLAIGNAMDNIGAGLAIGLAIGAASGISECSVRKIQKKLRIDFRLHKYLVKR